MVEIDQGTTKKNRKHKNFFFFDLSNENKKKFVLNISQVMKEKQVNISHSRNCLILLAGGDGMKQPTQPQSIKRRRWDLSKCWHQWVCDCNEITV